MADKTKKDGKIKTKILRYMFVGIIFVSVLGSLAHFFYDWSGKNKLVALFCPVNESTWEHMKLLFFPMLLYTFCPIKTEHSRQALLLPAMLAGSLSGTFLIPILFYTYSGALGYTITAIDIGTFYVSVISAFAAAWQLMGKNTVWYKTIVVGITILVCILFFIFTFYPPKIALFANPATITSAVKYRSFYLPKILRYLTSKVIIQFH